MTFTDVLLFGPAQNGEIQRILQCYGVSDSFVDADDLLSRNNPQASNELMATLELGYL
jgi:hypothetical protein